MNLYSLGSSLVGLLFLFGIFSATDGEPEYNLVNTYWKIFSFSDSAIWNSRVGVNFVSFEEDSIWYVSPAFGCFPMAYYLEGSSIYRTSDIPPHEILEMKITSYNDSILTLRLPKENIFARRIDSSEYGYFKYLYCEKPSEHIHDFIREK